MLAVALGAGENVGGIAALVAVDDAVGDLPGGGADGVQEPTVVGHDKHRAAPGSQMPSQPRDRLNVEMVGRLIEEEKLRSAEQYPREGNATTLASGQRSDHRVEARRESAELDAAEEPAEDLAESTIPRPFVVGARAHELVANRGLVAQLVALREHRDL